MIHILVFLVMLVIAPIISYTFFESELFQNTSAKFSTAGGFLTAYGVTFAVVELLRLKKVVQLVKEKSEDVFNRVTELITSREITECQVKIRIAIDSLNEGRGIQASILCSVLQLYSQIFHSELKNKNEDYVSNRSIVECYVNNPDKKAIKKPIKTIHALQSMIGQLAELQGETKKFNGEQK